MMMPDRMLPVVGALVWLTFKYVGLIWLTWDASAMAGGLVHMLILLGLGAWAAQTKGIADSNRCVSFLDALIAVLRVTFRYVLVGGVAVGVWYFVLNADGVDARKAEQVMRIEDALGSDEAFQRTLEVAPELSAMDRQTVYENQLETLEMYYSAPFHLGFALLALAGAALGFSLVVTLVWRFVWGN